MICTLRVYCYEHDSTGGLRGKIQTKVIKGKRQGPQGYGFVSDALIPRTVDPLYKTKVPAEELKMDRYIKEKKDVSVDKLVADGEIMFGQQFDFIHLVFDLTKEQIADIQKNHYRVDLTQILSEESLLEVITPNKRCKWKPEKVCKHSALELLDEQYWIKEPEKEELEKPDGEKVIL